MCPYWNNKHDHVAGRRTAPGVRESIKECRLKNRGSWDSARYSFDPSTNKISVDYKTRGNYTERFIVLKVGERWMVLVQGVIGRWQGEIIRRLFSRWRERTDQFTLQRQGVIIEVIWWLWVPRTGEVKPTLINIWLMRLKTKLSSLFYKMPYLFKLLKRCSIVLSSRSIKQKLVAFSTVKTWEKCINRSLRMCNTNAPYKITVWEQLD